MAGVQRVGQPAPGPGRGSVAPSASGVQTGHTAGAGSQPASAWGRPATMLERASRMPPAKPEAFPSQA